MLTKEERQELTQQVVKLQNHPELEDQDHVTITGFFQTREEFEEHIAHLEKLISERKEGAA